jgi:hypothetical protein
MWTECIGLYAKAPTRNDQGLFVYCCFLAYYFFVLIIPQPGYIKPDEKLSAFYFFTS